ncbi:extracellular solute-binding protein [Actinomadura sp. HBU206391]|uniref:extracellular solute-binding protein n=1 Tax=Actinomadura sp. HBU206391 TaxID=2731692 RepID=UPI00164F6B7E|nr:extracellular solute-binding protein [Actinomadura sp. HBU206391]MBC6462058.1 extracellular solute-binding protein [Actinomadura sp. HBU206391]
MRRQLFVSSLALVTVLGSGCATSGKSSTEQADTSAPATITYWSTGADEDTAIFQKAADLYKRSHPNVTIKVQTITWDDAYAKLLAAATGRSGPDLISGGLTWAIQFGRRGGMVDLRKYGIDAIQPKAHASMWKNATSPDGSVYGVPPDMSTEVLYYRTDLLAKAGLSAPQAERALRYWIDLHREYGAPTATVEGMNALDTGTAMVQGGSWIAKTIDHDKPGLKGKWAMAALPAGPAGATTFVGGRAVGVMSFSKYVRQPADFIKFLYSDEAIETMGQEAKGRNLSYIPPRPDRLDQAFYPPEQTSVFKEVFRTGQAAPGCPGWDESAPDVAKQLQSAILGKATPRSALQQAAKIMERNAG